MSTRSTRRDDPPAPRPGTALRGLAVSTFMLGRLTLDVARWNIVVPNVLSGLATGFVFVPLTTVAMGRLSNRQIGNATGLYNLMRNIGGSIGIAAATTSLARSAQRHWTLLIGHLSPDNPIYRDELAALQAGLAPEVGGPAAADQAQAILYQLVQRQATFFAFVDTVRLIAATCVLCAPSSCSSRAGYTLKASDHSGSTAGH